MSDTFPSQNELLLKKNFQLLQKEKKLLQEEIFSLLCSYFDSLEYSESAFTDVASVFLNECDRLFDDFEVSGKHWEIKLCLCQYLAQRYSFEDVLPTLEINTSSSSNSQIVCWATNQYAEKALAKFSKLFPSSKTVYVDSFSQVCDLVEGADHFGILPIENSADGRLVGFYRLIDKHELKICAVCDIEDDAGETFTRFALVSGDLKRLASQYPIHVELSVISPNRTHFMEVIKVSEQLEISGSRMFSVPLYYNREEAGNDTITLTIYQKSALPFFIYLYLFGKDINVLGFYIQF